MVLLAHGTRTYKQGTMKVVIVALILCCAVINAYGRPIEQLDEKRVYKRNNPEKDSILVMRAHVGIHSSEGSDESLVKEPEEEEEEDEEESPSGDEGSSNEEHQSENDETIDDAADSNNDHHENEHDDEDDNDDDDDDDDDDDEDED
ncbi:phosphopantothenoylcysteine decarboxylase subunit VHS3-like isoform X1 [Pocillopora damicornis]|uniref:phosphopantothenoylcysteine decarboxylase subunit VHS3-like isoform X1 n=2 Tax=Pocillopora damicornis TaxID=46731 RepID=UPI000F557BA1|nr:phosphopantothenoylcysteine decarboxylase subunit VHS3-like isoform X1 [Pocillopora damicornis]